MATWELTTEEKKSSIERQFWYNDGKVIIREEGFRWSTFTVESDDRPLTDSELRNEDGYELGCIDNDECWEMQDMTDGCWSDLEAGSNCTDEDLAAFSAAWDADWYSGVEQLGWSQDDTEYYMRGPLKLVNLDTGKEWSGLIDPATIVHTIELPVDTVIETVHTDPVEPTLTDWFPEEINPVRKGRYQVTRNGTGGTWPGPGYADWDGKAWSVKDIGFWRGITK